MAQYSAVRNHLNFPRMVEEAGLRLIDLVIRTVKFVRKIKNCAREILILNLAIYARSMASKCVLEFGTLTTLFVWKIFKIAQSLLSNIYKLTTVSREIDTFSNFKRQNGS